MKRTTHIFALVSIIVLFASCDKKMDFVTRAFVSLDKVSFSVDENVGTVTIPVSLYNSSAESVSVTVTGVDGTGKAGTDYEITTPSSGVLSFASGETQKEIVVSIKEFKGVFSGNKAFSIKMSSATGGIQTGANQVADFVIKDLDHPLLAFMGEWVSAENAVTSLFEGSYTLDITIAPYPEDVTKLVINNLDPYFASNGFTAANGYNILNGQVDAGKTTITIAGKQITGYKHNVQGNVWFFGYDLPMPEIVDDNIVSPEGDITMVLKPDGTLSIPNAYGIRTEAGYWELYLGGITLTKK